MIGRQKNNTPAQEGNPSRLPKSLFKCQRFRMSFLKFPFGPVFSGL
jgi:hypothetical protein